MTTKIGLLEDKYIYEGSDEEVESDEEKETVTKTKKKDWKVVGWSAKLTHVPA